MTDSTRPGEGTDRAPVDAWEKAAIGLDKDPWLRRFNRSSRFHESPDDALAFYTRIFMEAPLGIVILTPNHSVADLNVAAQRQLQRPLEKIRGKPFVRNVAKSDRHAFMDIMYEIDGNSGKTQRPLRLVDPSGKETELTVIGSAVTQDDGKVEYVMLMLVDSGDNESLDIL